MEFQPAITRPLVTAIRGIRRNLLRLENALYARTAVPVPLSVRLPGTGTRVAMEVRGVPGRDIALGGVDGYEPTTIALWRKLARRSDVVLDVGANYGLFSILAADENPNARVFAFEPLPEVLAALRRNVLASGYGDRLRVVPAAASERSGSAEFVVKGTSGSTLERGFWEETTPLPRIRVTTLALGEWCRSQGIAISPTSLVKMDIETHEPAAFRGATEVLAAGPAILCEVLATFVEHDLAPLFPEDQWGYWWIGPAGPVRRRRIVGDPSWAYANYLFLRADSPFRDVVAKTGDG